MKALIIIGIIIFALALISVFILMSDIYFGLSHIEGKTKWYVRWFFVKYKSDKEKKDKDNTDNKTEAKPEKKKPDVNEITEKVKEFSALLSSALNVLSDVLEKIYVSRLRIHIVCAGEDASFTGISYGICCAVIYPVLGIIKGNTNVGESGEDVSVLCDFEKKESEFYADIVAKIRIINLISVAIKFLKDYQKQKH